MNRLILVAWLLILSPLVAATEAAVFWQNKQFKSAHQRLLHDVERGNAATSTWIYLTRYQLIYGEPDKALEYIEHAVAMTPDNAEAHYYLGTTFRAKFRLGDLLEKIDLRSKVVTAFEKAISLNEENVDYLKGLFYFYLDMPWYLSGGIKEAQQLANRISGIDKLEGVHVNSLILKEQGNVEEAVKLVDDAVIADSDSARSRYYRGRFLSLVKGDHLAAFEDFEAAIENSEENSELQLKALYAYGRTAVFAHKNVNKGIGFLLRYISAPTYPEYLNSRDWARFRLANLYGFKGQYSKERELHLLIVADNNDQSLLDRVMPLLKE